jgi:predicted transcriptional regulator
MYACGLNWKNAKSFINELLSNKLLKALTYAEYQALPQTPHEDGRGWKPLNGSKDNRVKVKYVTTEKGKTSLRNYEEMCKSVSG